MIQILIFDDDKRECEWAKKILLHYGSEYGKEMQIETVSDEKKLMEHVRGNQELDIVFLDICVEEKAVGIDLAKEINAIAPDILIVFLTGYLVYAVDVYATNHVYFVLKEQLEMRLPNVFQRLEIAIKAKKNGHIRVLAKGKEIIVREDEIRYIERKGRNTHIVCYDRMIDISQKLSELEEKLASEAFVRCHNSFIVNLNSVQELKRTEILLERGEIIPVSRYRLERTREQFLRWMGE